MFTILKNANGITSVLSEGCQGEVKAINIKEHVFNRNAKAEDKPTHRVMTCWADRGAHICLLSVQTYLHGWTKSLADTFTNTHTPPIRSLKITNEGNKEGVT